MQDVRIRERDMQFVKFDAEDFKIELQIRQAYFSVTGIEQLMEKKNKPFWTVSANHV